MGRIANDLSKMAGEKRQRAGRVRYVKSSPSSKYVECRRSAQIARRSVTMASG